MKTTFVIIFIFLGLVSAERKEGEITYKLMFDDSLLDCKDYTNEVADARKMKLNCDDNSLEGDLGISQKLGDGVQLYIEIVKLTDNGEEPVATSQMPLCEAIKEKDAPWAPVFEAMGISECPITAKVFEIAKLELNVDWAKDILTHEYVSQYSAILKLKSTTEDKQKGEVVLVCFALAVSIIEVKKSDE